MKAGWSLGWVSAIDSQGRTIWIADAHGNGKRFVVRADEKLPAFLELERAVCTPVDLALLWLPYVHSNPYTGISTNAKTRSMTIIEIRAFRNG